MLVASGTKFCKHWWQSEVFLSEKKAAHCDQVLVVIELVLSSSMKWGVLSAIGYVQHWVKKRYESESIYASESDFGWSRKVFPDHRYAVDGLGRHSDTIQNLIWCWLRWCQKAFRDHPNLILMHKLIRNRRVSDSTVQQDTTHMRFFEDESIHTGLFSR